MNRCDDIDLLGLYLTPIRQVPLRVIRERKVKKGAGKGRRHCIYVRQCHLGQLSDIVIEEMRQISEKLIYDGFVKRLKGQHV